ncbi:MAG: phosphomannose isomerase type II C-terminal cupin domain [Candidatus Margulisbacteria bacterium]|jgi:mannose-6-phosphate isomerase-like protein (cupin superfamily)|nr:phosphomannose isomerase type II C-terminal cupin domain [Candidatus Margulisiibacteriota bacterium]
MANNYVENRPWGSFEVLLDNVNYKVKTLTVSPQKRLSLQSHKWRSENWVVVAGQAYVEIDDEFLILDKGQHVFIPIGAKHRLENKGEVDLVVVETQTGDYFGEDDIVRYADDFQRT